MTKEKIQRRINRAEQHLFKLENREEHLSKHGYWSIGYFKGMLSVSYDWLDELEELNGKV